MPQDQKDSQFVDSIASRHMGVEPAQQQAPAPTSNDDPNKKDTDQGEAAEQGSPDTEGDRSRDDAMVMEIEFGENDKRKLNPNQIKSALERYSSLNYKHARYKPVIDLIERLDKENPGSSPKDLIAKMAAFAEAGEHNPTMGDTNRDPKNKAEGTGKSVDSPEDMEAMLSKWEEENAASLPPGYKEMILGGNKSAEHTQRIEQQLAQTQQMLQRVLAQSQGTADAAKAGVAEGQSQQANAIRQTIANNIDRVSQHMRLPDDKADDFMMFAAERGYTLEDFVDPQLTVKVMTDFKNNMDSPEMERLRNLASRRQAFTGSMGAATQSESGAAGAQPEGTFDKFAAAAMAKRGMQ